MIQPSNRHEEVVNIAGDIEETTVGLAKPAAMASRLAVMVAEHPGFAVLSYIMTADMLLEWAHSVGVTTDERLRASVAQVPPRHLREIVAAPEEELFLWTGARDLQIFKSIYETRRHRLQGHRPRVLDFGCGCGRMTRYLEMDSGFEAYGSDVNGQLVEWCQANMRRVTTKLNGVAPPLDFEAGFFDFVYTLSIFTHLPEPVAAMWLDELARVSAKNALVVVTTHGYPALNIIRNSVVHHNMFGLDTAKADDLIRRLPDEGFIFLPYGEDLLTVANAGASYGNVFIDPGYAAKRWNTRDLKVVEHIRGGLRGWQDIFVLRRL